ncbi:MAG: hypothetical protein ACLQBB_15260 [Solirubrobacteraceae bacterium]
MAVLPASVASASDSSATSAYLRANYALVAAGHAHLGASIAGYRSVLAQVRRECPLAAAESPQDPESTELSNEVIGTMVLTAGKPDRPAIRAFLHAASGLRWSSASVTHAVAGYVSMLGRLYSLSVPDLCGDVTSWGKAKFRSLPATTLSFEKIFYPNWVALGLLPPGLARFEDARDRELARRSAGFEYQLTNVEAEAVETWGEIMDELSLNP